MTRLDALRNLPKGFISPTESFSASAIRTNATEVVSTIRINPPIIAASIDDAFTDALESLLKAQHDLDAVMLQYRHERQRLAGILATFAASPISASSLQPILDLAAEMNKEAK